MVAAVGIDTDAFVVEHYSEVAVEHSVDDLIETAVDTAVIDTFVVVAFAEEVER